MPRNTITNKQMADLRRRAQKADRESWVSKRAVARRLADQKQRKKAQWS